MTDGKPTFLALLIRLSSPGPAIFRQVRCGLNGRRFVFYKFRSMCQNAEAMRAEARRRLGMAAMHASLLRASDWFMAQAMLPEAVETALDAQAYPRAAAIVE